MNASGNDARDGVIAGLIAYTLWGFLPIYFKLVETVQPTEVLAHRIVWAVPFGALIVYFRKQWPEVRRALTHRTMLMFLASSAILVAINWYTYIYAIVSDQVFQASLGYYINPLLYVVAGMVFFGETLSRLQLSAVILAAIGVLILTFSGGQIPVIALVLGVSFTIYGVIRKRVVIGGMPGLFVETIVLLPIAGVWLSYLLLSGQSAFTSDEPGLMALLLFAGPITVIPLLCFALAARRVSLAMLGFMQFLAPSLQFLMGVYYGEQLTLPHWICFGCIWIAVALFSTDALKNRQPA